ncbi:MAG: type II toxin-antitoxin system HicA family toxin [Acidobacteria bacterium]|nr:type II toxin-antitoxin system HicA family toxin [Acidobacteriota bacterium]
MKVRDIIKRLQADGWILETQRGSHRQFVNPAFSDRKVTVNGKPGNDYSGDLLRWIFEQAGWDWKTRR